MADEGTYNNATRQDELWGRQWPLPVATSGQPVVCLDCGSRHRAGLYHGRYWVSVHRWSKDGPRCEALSRPGLSHLRCHLAVAS